MKLILIHEKDRNISGDILLHAIRNDGYASIDDVNFYRILSYNDTHVILEDQNSGISVEYSDIKSIKITLIDDECTIEYLPCNVIFTFYYLSISNIGKYHTYIYDKMKELIISHNRDKKKCYLYQKKRYCG